MLFKTYRKDAIYRRMKHYRRESDRSRTKIAELEQRRSTCEAGLAALVACWSQVHRFTIARKSWISNNRSQIVEIIHSIVHADDLPPVDVETQGMLRIQS